MFVSCFFSKDGTKFLRILNSEVRAEPHVGRVGVDALGATCPRSDTVSWFQGPPRRSPGASLMPENLDIGRRGPRSFLFFLLNHQLGLAVAGLAVHLVDLKLARLPDREVKNVL